MTVSPDPMQDPKVLWDIAKETMPLYIDNAKSYAALAAGALGLTIVFREKVLGESGSVKRTGSLFFSWLCLLMTIGLSAFYQWLAVRWMELRLEILNKGIDTRFPMNLHTGPGFVYGAMLVFFFAGSTTILFTFARQLLSSHEPLEQTEASGLASRWRRGVLAFCVLLIVTVFAWCFAPVPSGLSGTDASGTTSSHKE